MWVIEKLSHALRALYILPKTLILQQLTACHRLATNCQPLVDHRRETGAGSNGQYDPDGNVTIAPLRSVLANLDALELEVSPPQGTVEVKGIPDFTEPLRVSRCACRWSIATRSETAGPGLNLESGDLMAIPSSLSHRIAMLSEGLLINQFIEDKTLPALIARFGKQALPALSVRP